MAVILR